MVLLLLGVGALGGCGRERASAVSDSETLGRADNQWARGEIEPARASLSKILEEDPKFFPALYRRGVLALWDDPPAATRDLEAAATLAPDHPGPPLFLGVARILDRDLEGGRAKIDEAFALAERRAGYVLPDSGEVRHGLLSLRSGGAAHAAQDFQHAVAADTSNVELWLLWGTAALRGGDPDLVLVCAERALELEPDLAAAHALRGLALMQHVRIPEARDALARALEKGAAPPDAYYLAGQIELASSNYRDAAKAFWAAALEDPTVGEYHQALGDVLMRMMQRDLGSRHLQIAETVKSVAVGHMHTPHGP